MTNRLLVYTGTISYGLFLLYKIPFDAAQSFGLEHYAVLVLPLGLAAAYAMAATVLGICWKKPFLL